MPTSRNCSDRLETVAVVYSQPELALLFSLFENESIWVAPVSYYHVSAQWNLTVPLGGVELRVHESDAGAARALLAGIERAPFTRGIFSDTRLIEIILVLGLFLVGFFAPPARIPAFFLLDGRPGAARDN